MAKILIADDSRFQVQVLASSLEGKGFELTFAYDALQAWMAALRQSPDLILLDINMPAGTGLEVLKRLRRFTKTQNIPVVVITGDVSPIIESAVRDLGITDFLHKPIEEHLLRNTIDNALSPKSGIKDNGPNP